MMQFTLDDMIVNGEITQDAWMYLDGLVRVVAFRYYRDQDVEDLISLSLPDVASFLIKVHGNTCNGFNKPRNIRNVLFTRIRNTMSNYLFKTQGRGKVHFLSLDCIKEADLENSYLEPKYEFDSENTM